MVEAEERLLLDNDNSSLCASFPDHIIPDYYGKNAIRVTVSTVLFYLGLVYMIISTARFIYYQKQFIRLKKRSLMLQILFSLGLLIQLFGGVFTDAYTIPCWIGVLFRSLVVPIVCIPVPLRLLDYFNRYVLAEILLMHSRPHLAPHETSSSSLRISIRQTPKTPTSPIPLFKTIELKSLLMTSPQESVRNIINKADISTPTPPTTSDTTANSSAAGHEHDQNHIHNHPHISKENHDSQELDMYYDWENDKLVAVLKLLSSTRIRFLFFLLVLFPFLVVIINDFATVTYLFPSSHCFYCNLSPNLGVLIIVAGVLMISLGSAFAVKLRKHPDPFGVLQECKQILKYGGMICLIGFVCDRYIKEATLKGFSFGWITYLGVIVLQIQTTDYQLYICHKGKGEKKLKGNNFDGIWKRRKRSKEQLTDIQETRTMADASQVESGDSDQLHFKILTTILHDPTERSYFEKHLIAEFAVENIILYQEIEHYERVFYDINENTRRARAKKIIEQFIREDSMMQVNIPDEVRVKVIGAVENKDKSLDVDLFDETKKELFNMLYGSYIRYEGSRTYKLSHPSTAASV